MAAPLFLSLSHFLSTSASFHLFYFLFFFTFPSYFDPFGPFGGCHQRRIPPFRRITKQKEKTKMEREREKEREAMASRRPTSSTASPSTSGHRNRPTFIGSVNTAVIAGVRRDVAKKKKPKKNSLDVRPHRRQSSVSKVSAGNKNNPL